MSTLMRVILCRDMDEDGFRHTGAILFLVLSARQFLLWLFLQFPLLTEICGLFIIWLQRFMQEYFQNKVFVHLVNAEGF